MSIKASMKGNFSSSCLISSSNLALCASNSCFLNLPGKGRGGLYGGGPAGVSFFFATGLAGWLELALSVLFSARSSSGLSSESRFLQLDRVLVQGFVPARSSWCRDVILDQILPFLVIDVHSDLGWATLLGNCRPLLSVTAWAYS
ncbi:unnamed protein product [Microthlaspi erraticum]|uniref:Uncharacterized protein n=1 Tax=Microthlaspi erraticum TaxID=1685480 RepID=A0A6D2JLK0_9BRAS|nr:unnamed protein product [Microthlaspi erraticum]